MIFVCLVFLFCFVFLPVFWEHRCGEGLDRGLQELGARRSIRVAPVPFHKKQPDWQINTGDRRGRWHMACAGGQLVTGSVWSYVLKAFPKWAFLWCAMRNFLQLDARRLEYPLWGTCSKQCARVKWGAKCFCLVIRSLPVPSSDLTALG